MDGPGRAPQLPRRSSRGLQVMAHPAGHGAPCRSSWPGRPD